MQLQDCLPFTLLLPGCKENSHVGIHEGLRAMMSEVIPGPLVLMREESMVDTRAWKETKETKRDSVKL